MEGGDAVLLVGGLGEYGGLDEDNGHGHHVTAVRVHVHQLHVVVVAEPELFVRGRAQSRGRLVAELNIDQYCGLELCTHMYKRNEL